MDYARETRKIITDNLYMTIATASKDGKPWISPVVFSYDDKYNLYWFSAKDSKHSKLIKCNPDVAIVIFDSRAPEGTGNGVYITAKASEVGEKELQYAVETYRKRVRQLIGRQSSKTYHDFIGDLPLRFYKAVPKKAWTLRPPIERKGYQVDLRVEVKL